MENYTFITLNKISQFMPIFSAINFIKNKILLIYNSIHPAFGLLPSGAASIPPPYPVSL